MVCFCFFFVKLKTAYDLRISDWGSDVCSSDLGQRLGRGEVWQAVDSQVFQRHQQPRLAVVADVAAAHRHRLLLLPAAQVPAIVSRRFSQIQTAKIGRASCRESECTDV